MSLLMWLTLQLSLNNRRQQIAFNNDRCNICVSALDKRCQTLSLKVHMFQQQVRRQHNRTARESNTSVKYIWRQPAQRPRTGLAPLRGSAGRPHSTSRCVTLLLTSRLKLDPGRIQRHLPPATSLLPRRHPCLILIIYSGDFKILACS